MGFMGEMPDLGLSPHNAHEMNVVHTAAEVGPLPPRRRNREQREHDERRREEEIEALEPHPRAHRRLPKKRILQRVTPEVARRREQVVLLHNGGASRFDIALKLNVSIAQVERDLAESTREAIARTADEIRGQQLLVLRDLKRAVFARALKGEAGAWDRMLKALDHEAKLLGAYAPARVAVTTPEGEGFEEATARMLSELQDLRAERAAALEAGKEHAVEAVVEPEDDQE